MKHLFKLFPSILSEMFRNAKKLRNVWVAAAGFDELDLCHLEEVMSSNHSSVANYGNRCETFVALIWQTKLRSCLCLHHLRMIEAAAERKARHFQSPAASASKGVSQISLMLLWYETEARHGYAIRTTNLSTQLVLSTCCLVTSSASSSLAKLHWSKASRNALRDTENVSCSSGLRVVLVPQFGLVWLHIITHWSAWLACFMLIESPFVAMGAQPRRYPQLATPQQQDAQENVATLWHHMASHGIQLHSFPCPQKPRTIS